MTTELLPWFTAFLVGVVVALLMVIAVVLLPRVGLARALTRRFLCPWAGREVQVRFLAESGRQPDRVISCSAFADPLIVVCERRCLAEPAVTTLTAREPEPVHE